MFGSEVALVIPMTFDGNEDNNATKTRLSRGVACRLFWLGFVLCCYSMGPNVDMIKAWCIAINEMYTVLRYLTYLKDD